MEEKKFNYTKLLCSKRPSYINSDEKWSPAAPSKQRSFISDRSRILYCPAFRRLQQKAQVFSLETNSNVRSRLTHSLEVADLGRRLATEIGYKLDTDKYEKEVAGFNVSKVVSIVENACLLHDIGNPPFGHFGEAAIKDWARNRAKQLAHAGMTAENEQGQPVWTVPLDTLMQDFEEFDGNPQGFRTVTRLFTDFGRHGLNLTYGTLLCALKYARGAGEAVDLKAESIPKDIVKKAGYFQTEADLVAELCDVVNLPVHRRFPLTYIMEAADDIAYCMSDIADGIEKGLLTVGEFVEIFARKWDEQYGGDYPAEIEALLPEQMKKKRGRKSQKAEPAEAESRKPSFNRDFSVPWSTRATQEAAEVYVSDHAAIFRGEALPLMERGGEMCRIFKIIRAVCEERLYPSIEAESIELTGYAVISGILRHYERILSLDFEAFEWLADPQEAKRKHKAREELAGTELPKVRLDVERRLYNRIDAGCVQAYRNAVKDLRQAPGLDAADFAAREWWLRVHLLMDHISSMTDLAALETYQMLEGIALMRT